MKVLYWDCFAGMAGDMAVAALVDAGTPESVVAEGVARLGLPGLSVSFERAMKNGISALRFVVRDESGRGEHGHCHRSMADIRALLAGSELSRPVVAAALDIFGVIARAEGKIHGVAPEDVRFHEVGALDSIADITGVALCLDYLKPDRIECSVVREGTGLVRCAHGTMPVPAPATLEILSACGAVIRQTDTPGEMVTPTGAGVLAACCSSFGAPCPEGKILSAGYGAGAKDFEHPNAVRVLLVETGEGGYSDSVCVLETALDDCPGEALGFAMERFFEAGAKDAYFTPIYMKKNRPGVLLTVLCSPGDEGAMTAAIFRHTTAIGLRRRINGRTVCRRGNAEVSTEYGPVGVKSCEYGGAARAFPEYESAKKAALEHGVPIRDVYAAAVRAAEKH